jgi:selenocysteine lyase/cysteine desulfurase
MATRREFLKDTALIGAALTAPLTAMSTGRVWPQLAPPQGTPAQVAGDEAFWAQVAGQYRVTDAVTNFEAGYFGLMATPVLEAYHRHVDRANRDNSYFARREYPALAQQVRAQVAAFIGAAPTTINFSRNATEALQALIGQYNRLRPGDTIVYADLDYPAMQQSMQALAARTGARLVTFDIPEPASRQGVLDAYAQVLEANPTTRLLLVTHCNNKTGLLLPVKDIAALARPRGIDIVCDCRSGRRLRGAQPPQVDRRARGCRCDVHPAGETRAD